MPRQHIHLYECVGWDLARQSKWKVVVERNTNKILNVKLCVLLLIQSVIAFTYHLLHVALCLLIRYLMDCMCNFRNLFVLLLVLLGNQSEMGKCYFFLCVFLLLLKNDFGHTLTVLCEMGDGSGSELSRLISVRQPRKLSGKICCVPWYQIMYNGGSNAPVTIQCNDTLLPSLT